MIMEIKKWIPWNWFKKEEEDASRAVPAKHAPSKEHELAHDNAILQFHHEVDRLFDKAFGNFGLSPFRFNQSMRTRLNDGLLKPTLDLGATDREYTIAVEIPGVDEKDVKVEISNDTLTIQGEKKLENEEKGKSYYRMERSYGSFQRTLSLPEDADQDNVAANFKKGILTVTMPRKAIPKTNVKQIEVKRR
jgi:HSP20 family protein